MPEKKLAIITTHPIQYNAPFFKLLAQRNIIEIKVFYTWGEKVLEEKYDPGFKKVIKWDIPLLDGYESEFLENVAQEPGSHHFKGIDNPGLINSINHWKADAILIYGWSFKSHLKAIRYFKGKIPVLFRGDSTILDSVSTLKKIIRNLFLKWVYSHVSYVLYVGSSNKEYFESIGLNEDQMIFVPHSVENKRFNVAASNISTGQGLRAELGINRDAILFLFAGKLEPKKNCKLLIDAFKKIENPNVHLLIVGNGILEDGLKTQTKDNSNIHFKDFQNQQQMPAIYQMADVYVLASGGPGETWGLSVNEAMAAGKPVVVSDACGCAKDLVKNGVNGFVFKSNNLNDLSEKILRLSEDKIALNTMGEASRQIIKDWNFENGCIAIENLIHRILIKFAK